MLTYLRQEAGPADLLRLFGMNEGKNECEREPCHHHKLDRAPTLPGEEKEILSGMRPRGLLRWSHPAGLIWLPGVSIYL